jgi:hypothetical protein
MKKFLVVALAALCVAALLPQSLAAGVGIKGGLAMSKFAIKPAGTFPFPIENLTSPVGGVYFNLGLGPVSFEMDVLYARMGMKGTFEGVTMEYRLDYVQVPVALKFKVIPVGPIRPFISAGGYGSYLLKAKGVLIAPEGSESGDLGDMFQKYDYGVVGGAGVEFKLPGLTISAEGRYNLGLANIVKEAGEGESGKNRSIMALVGIGF